VKQPETPLKRGDEILTHAVLGSTEDTPFDADELARRRPNARGKITSVVAGTHGAWWWVDHEGTPSRHKRLAPYRSDELQVVEPVFTTEIAKLAVVAE